MNFYRTRKWMLALLALMLVMAMAGCKGESSPTAPNPTGSSGGTGSTTPPSGATVALAVSNSTPVVDSSSTITATVSLGGTPVPNGTAVEFVTDAGSFVQGASPAVLTVIKTTTNGVASITIFSSTAVTATITATVNNVTKSTSVRFVDKIVTPVPPSTAPTITGVTPPIGSPAGGQIITITGTNFRTPLSVLFDPGTGALPTQLTVVSSTDSTIQVITPKVNIAAGQQQKFGITVITQQGSASEQRVSLPSAFTYQLDVLTPTPTTASPATGPIDGGTRVTIFGSGFQAPVQVFFGAAEAQVIKVAFDQLQVITPTARSAGVITGAIGIRIINVNSAKEATLASGFAYAEKMTITSMAPTQGPLGQGTRVTLEGSGFDTGGVAVVIGGIAASPVFVSGTKLIAVTGVPVVTSCANVTGATSVTNINNGDHADGLPFTFVLAKPSIASVTSSPVTAGSTFQVTVINPLGTPRFTVSLSGASGVVAPVSGSVTNADGSVTYTVIVPSNIPLTQTSCPGTEQGTNGVAPTGPQQTQFDVTYTSLFTTCTDTAPKSLTVNPIPGLPVVTYVGSFVPFVGAISPGPPASVVTTPATQTVNVVNSGTGTVTGTMTFAGSGGTGCARFSLPPSGTGFALSECDFFSISASYSAPTVPTPVPDSCTVTVTTTTPAGTKSFTLTGSSH